MQLSLPPPVYPSPPAPNPDHSHNSSRSDEAAAPAGESFDSYLVHDKPEDDHKSDDKKNSDEAEKAAAILAALLWMPAVPVVDPATIAVTALPAGQTAATQPGDAIPGPTCARSFSILTTDVTTSAPSADKSVVPDALSKDGGVPLAKVDPAQEKIAPLPVLPLDSSETFASSREKYFLDPMQKAVTGSTTALGITVAKLNASMPAAAPVRSKSSSLSEPTGAFVFSAEAAPSATLTLDAPAPVATIRETLAAVISAVEALERRADMEQKSVDLQFHVGSEKLGLRVELRDGTVHTTFRTESSEMSGAIAREWHAVVQPALAREIRLADPVFNSATQGGNDSGFNLSRHDLPQPREDHQTASSSVSARVGEFRNSGISESAPVVSPASNSSQLLNVLA